jgi:hypothetical protein
MKKVFVLVGVLALCSCQDAEPKTIYPYGLTEQEWNSLSIRDQTRLRRDFYFYEKGSTNYVNPKLEVEGKAETRNVYAD